MTGGMVWAMTYNKHPMGPKSPMAIRLRRLRALYAENAAAFARQIGITPTRWNNFENGQPLSKSVAFLLCQEIPGLTLEWLFHGSSEGMAHGLWKRLEGSADPENATTRA